MSDRVKKLRQTTLDPIDIQDRVLSDADHCITVAEMAQDYNVTPDDSRYYWLYFEWPTEDGSYEKVVAWEISRIARKGTQAQRFFDAAEDNDTTIHVTDGSIRTIEPDGHGRLIADIIAAVAAEERRSLIRRIKAGIRRAKEEEKYVGQPPAGFVVGDDGNLRPNLSPDYDDGETGYLDMQDALEEIDDGQSYRAAAGSTPNVTRQTLSNIDNNGDRREMYMDSVSMQ